MKPREGKVKQSVRVWDNRCLGYHDSINRSEIINELPARSTRLMDWKDGCVHRGSTGDKKTFGQEGIDKGPKSFNSLRAKGVLTY